MLLRIFVVPALHLDEPEQQVGLGIARIELQRRAQMLDGTGRLSLIPKACCELELPK
jgi:hypothetical protein